MADLQQTIRDVYTAKRPATKIALKQSPGLQFEPESNLILFHLLQTLEDLPKPHKQDLVKLHQRPEQFYAVISFSGNHWQPVIEHKKEQAQYALSLTSIVRQ